MNSERDRKIIELALAGASALRIATEMGIDRHTVTRALRRAGVAPKEIRAAKAAARDEEILDAIRAGVPLTVLAERYGLTRQGVQHVAFRRGLRVREIAPKRTRPDIQAREAARDAHLIARTREGATLGELHVETGVTVHGIQRILRRAGIGHQERGVLLARRVAGLLEAGHTVDEISRELLIGPILTSRAVKAAQGLS